MSLCYDGEKWLVITLASVAISLTVGLVLMQFAYGQNAFSQVRDGLQLYNNTEYGFQILYPQDWNVVEGDAELGDFVTNIVTFEPSGKEGKHHSGKFICGEVCLSVYIDNAMLIESTTEAYLDQLNNDIKAAEGDYNLIEYNPLYKLGDKKGFEMSFEDEQGNRDYVHKIVGTTYPELGDSKSLAFLDVQFKTRDKYSDEMLPLGNTMIDSFRFTK
jgi:hypothetical protein